MESERRAGVWIAGPDSSLGPTSGAGELAWRERAMLKRQLDHLLGRWEAASQLTRRQAALLASRRPLNARRPLKSIRGQLTYANVMSTIAVFLILGGATAFAASQLPKNSVGTKQLKKNAVTTAKIKKDAVTGGQVKDGSLTGADVADGSLATADIADGSINSAKVLDSSLTGKDVAPDSLTGANILESTLGQVPDAAKLGGKAATAFTSSSIYKNESAVEEGTLFDVETHFIDEACNPGDVLITGGPANVNKTSIMLESFPTPGLTNSWRVRLKTPAADNFSVVVLCAKQG